MSDSYPRGRFVWHELLTTDPEAAQAFYTQLIGWGATPMEGAGEPYTMFMNGETPIGGLMKLPADAQAAGAPPHWMGYVAVPDVDATAKRATELGAKVLVPSMDVPGMGRFTVFQDPQGPTIAAWQAAGEPGGHDDRPAVGEFSWNELLTDDREAAFAFYCELFGWQQLTAVDMGPSGIYQIYGRAGTELPLGGMFGKTPDMPWPPNWSYYIRVPDVHQWAEKVKELGGQVVMAPMEVPGGDWIVQCTDPQGAHFALHHTGSGC